VTEAVDKGSSMLCRMPVVNVPHELIEKLKKSPSEKIDGTQGPGVASYLAPDGSVRANVYIGFHLDGLALYRNISSSHSSLKMQFALKPVVECPSKVLTFTPEQDYAITIQVL